MRTIVHAYYFHLIWWIKQVCSASCCCKLVSEKKTDTFSWHISEQHVVMDMECCFPLKQICLGASLPYPDPIRPYFCQLSSLGIISRLLTLWCGFRRASGWGPRDKPITRQKAAVLALPLSDATSQSGWREEELGGCRGKSISSTHTQLKLLSFRMLRSFWAGFEINQQVCRYLGGAQREGHHVVCEVRRWHAELIWRQRWFVVQSNWLHRPRNHLLHSER